MPYSEIYFLYGNILIDLGRVEDAKKALEKALMWNPMNAKIRFEYAETFKMQGDMERFAQETKETFERIYSRKDFARAYRNMGYYFIEKKNYEAAMGCYLFSLGYDDDGKCAQSEMYYIMQITEGKVKEPEFERFKEIAKEHGLPLDVDEDVVGIALSYGKYFLKEGDMDGAKAMIRLVYELTEDDDFKTILDEIENA